MCHISKAWHETLGPQTGATAPHLGPRPPLLHDTSHSPPWLGGLGGAFQRLGGLGGAFQPVVELAVSGREGAGREWVGVAGGQALAGSG